MKTKVTNRFANVFPKRQVASLLLLVKFSTEKRQEYEASSLLTSGSVDSEPLELVDEVIQDGTANIDAALQRKSMDQVKEDTVNDEPSCLDKLIVKTLDCDGGRVHFTTVKCRDFSTSSCLHSALRHTYPKCKTLYSSIPACGIILPTGCGCA